MKRPFGPVLLVLLTAPMVWAIIAAHAIWSIGYELNYLDKGHPLYPSLTVGYGTFFIESIILPMVFILVGTPVLFLLWNRTILIPLTLVALASAIVGADAIVFNYQIDFGTTWGPAEALNALFVDPIATPLSGIAIVLFCAGLARVFRPKQT